MRKGDCLIRPIPYLTRMIQPVIRYAAEADIPQIQRVRNAVKENTLSDPALVPDADVADYICRRGKGWVSLQGDQVIGFAIVSVLDNNVWALFMDPGFDKQGIGRRLHDLMMDWYFDQTAEKVWLSTTPGTRAEKFYRKAGWVEDGTFGKGEVRFVMTRDNWIQQKSAAVSTF